MKAGRELDALIAEKIMGWTSVTNRRHAADTWTGVRHDWSAPVVDDVPHYSTKIGSAWHVVEKMHAHIDPAEMGRYQYLTLVCTGAYGESWAASFDFNLSHDWYEADVIVTCPFAAKSDTAPRAICLAALAALNVEVPS